MMAVKIYSVSDMMAAKIIIQYDVLLIKKFYTEC